MHHIQRKILQQLLYTESLGYAQLRPKAIESNHFAYHLGRLLRAKIVIKKDRLYTLSPEGLRLVDRLSQGKLVERLQPHIVTAIDLTNAAGQTLLYKRAFQPYIHRLGFPLGKIHFEESVTEAAVRELAEKTGLGGIRLVHRGVVYLESKSQGVTISKVLYHVLQGTTQKMPLQVDPMRGSCRWADVTKLKDHEVMPGFRAIKHLLAISGSSLFFAELSEVLEEM